MVRLSALCTGRICSSIHCQRPRLIYTQLTVSFEAPNPFFSSLWGQQSLVGQGLLIFEASQTHSHAHQDSYGRVISPTQRLLPDTQHSQQTDFHGLAGIRTHNPSKRAAAPRLTARPLGSAPFFLHYRTTSDHSSPTKTK